ncbi:MAG: cation:proton antiporter [Candidatus Manganitrophus sp. SA1]|nr:cation:proton antiporter [Candidatus Manganitrophus morganii]
MRDIILLQDLAVVMIVSGLVTVFFHRFHLPVVLGYILAGFIISPHTPPYPLISDEASIETLAQLGVIFLMFALGLDFNLRKLKQVGTAALSAAILEILVMVWLGYEVGQLFGWGKMDSLFLGAILSISSTTIILKALEELGKTKEKFAQMIFGILIVEDILAIMIIALLSTVAVTGSLQLTEVLLTAGQLAIFLVVALVFGLLAVPRLLRYVARYRSNEMLLVTVLGLCFGFSLLAVKFGYSIALGAFMIGAIIAEAREIGKIEHLVAPVRDMFSAVFFVAIGMQINPALLAQYTTPIIVITLVVVAGKIVTCTVGTLIAGHDLRTSMRVGMGLAQIGEFSFIIASLGITLNVTSQFLYPIAVTVSAATTLLTPFFIRSADGFVNWFDRTAPRTLVGSLSLYADWIKRLGSTAERSQAKRLARRLAWQIGLNMALITGAFLVAAYLAKRVEAPWLPEWIGGAKALVWLITLLITLVPLLATFRKFQSLGFLLAEISVRRSGAGVRAPAIRTTIANTILFGGTVFLALWILLISATFLPPWPVLFVSLILIAAVSSLLWRKLSRIHNLAQVALDEVWSPLPPHPSEGLSLPLLANLKEVELDTLSILERSSASGKLISELQLRSRTGASIIVIERNGDRIINPDPSEELRAGDKLLLLGDHRQLEEARRILFGAKSAS